MVVNRDSYVVRAEKFAIDACTDARQCIAPMDSLIDGWMSISSRLTLSKELTADRRQLSIESLYFLSYFVWYQHLA
jgi:hypothetical protein